MKLRQDSDDRAASGGCCVSSCWAFFISLCSGQPESHGASSNNPQMSLDDLPCDQTEHKTPYSPPATSPQGVHPTRPTKAILLLFGRPWAGGWETGWPNIVMLPRDTSRSHLPLPIWLLARTWLYIAPSAKPLESSCLQQAAILLLEIQSLFAGRRGKRRPDHTSSRHNRACSYRSLEAARRYRQRTRLDQATPWVEVVEALSFLPNVESIRAEKNL